MSYSQYSRKRLYTDFKLGFWIDQFVIGMWTYPVGMSVCHTGTYLLYAHISASRTEFFSTSGSKAAFDCGQIYPNSFHGSKSFLVTETWAFTWTLGLWGHYKLSSVIKLFFSCINHQRKLSSMQLLYGPLIIIEAICELRHT